MDMIVDLKSVFYLFLKLSQILDLTTELISFFKNSLSTLHTKEKLFFEKGSIANGPSFKKY